MLAIRVLAVGLVASGDHACMLMHLQASSAEKRAGDIALSRGSVEIPSDSHARMPPDIMGLKSGTEKQPKEKVSLGRHVCKTKLPPKNF